MKKKYFIILILFVFIIGTSYAWFRWTSSNNTDVSFNIDGITITYEAGNDISGIKLIPVSTLEKGLNDGTAIGKQITVSGSNNAYLDLNMGIEILDNGLKHETFVYQLKKGNDIVASGNFANYNEGDSISLLSGEQVNTTSTVYTLYIWIDGSITNPETMENQNFRFVLHANASSQKPVYASEKIIKLAGNCTSWTSGFSGICATNSYEDNGETKYHEYRYIGANVDNWVEFNGDMYRIIGAFDENSWGEEGNTEYGKYLLKLISADKIYTSAWGVYNDTTNHTAYAGSNNNWTGEASSPEYESEVNHIPASANILLNTYYLNPNASSTYGTCENLSYRSNNNNNYKVYDCSKIKRYGIQNQNMLNYIEDVTWYLYGNNVIWSNLYDIYKCERNNYTNCTSANSGKYKGTTISKIGLMYVSDYLFASSYTPSADLAKRNINSLSISTYNWLYSGYEWTIMPLASGNSNVFAINSNVSAYSSYYGFGLRPVFYLKSTIKLKAGTGSYNDPYKIA